MATALNHIGFIADGNRRWARARGLPTLQGHKKGFDNVDMIVGELLKVPEIKFVSFFVFSTENWDRSEEEVSYLMELLRSTINRMGKKAQKKNLRIIIMGRPDPVEPKLWQQIMQLQADTSQNTGLAVCFCFNYGGQWEIADAATRAIAAGETTLTPETFRQYLYHPEVPDCDLIVRTSGEQRISGFQLWRAAYSEFLFLDKHFPALEKSDVEYILNEYHKRQRRFGK